MRLLDLPDEILRIVVEQIRDEAFIKDPSLHRLPCLNTLCALALTSHRFTDFTSEAIYQEVRLVGDRPENDARKARWSCWTQSCSTYPQILDRIKILRVMWFAGFDQDLVDDMYSCLRRARDLKHLSLTVWTGLQHDSVIAHIGTEPVSLLNLRILELSFYSRRLMTPRQLNQICQLPSLNALTLQSQRFLLVTEQDGVDSSESNSPKEDIMASRIEKLVLDCKYLDRKMLEFLIKKAPKLKQLTIPDKIGINMDENYNSFDKPVPLRPTTIDWILQPLKESLEQITITTSRDYTPRHRRKTDCEQPVGFSSFSALKSLDVPCHFLFDLSGNGDIPPRKTYDLFPRCLKLLKLRFEYFLTIHELEQEWGMTPKDWHNAYLDYISHVKTGSVVVTQKCQWIALLLSQDREALETLRQVYARDRDFDISHVRIVAIDRKISGVLDGVDVSISLRTTETLLEE